MILVDSRDDATYIASFTCYFVGRSVSLSQLFGLYQYTKSDDADADAQFAVQFDQLFHVHLPNFCSCPRCLSQHKTELFKTQIINSNPYFTYHLFHFSRIYV